MAEWKTTTPLVTGAPLSFRSAAGGGGIWLKLHACRGNWIQSESCILPYRVKKGERGEGRQRDKEKEKERKWEKEKEKKRRERRG